MTKKVLLFVAPFLLFTSTFAQVIVPTLTITTTSTQATACTAPCNGTATVTNVQGGTPPYTYLWNPSGQSTPTATGLCPGTYQVGVFDSATPIQNLGTTTVTITCNTAIGINEDVNSNNEVILYPNPATDLLSLYTLNMDLNGATLIVRDLLGNAVATMTSEMAPSNELRIPVSHLIPGVYMIEIQNQGEITRNRFVKQ